MEPPTILHAVGDDLRAVDLTLAASDRLEPETAASRYPLVVEVNDGLGRKG